MRAEPGTYALILRCRSRAAVRVGRWGELTVRPGFYLYIGSAFGPGGVRARVLRHCREKKPKHWHIDYLRDLVSPFGVWCAYGARDLEHLWAHRLSGMECLLPVPGFGCSDCACLSHLFFSPAEPDPARFADAWAGAEYLSLVEPGD